MRLLLSLLLLLCLFPDAGAQPDNDLTDAGLRGRVRMVTETEYVDEAMKIPFQKTVDRYDRRGNLVETMHNDYVLKLNPMKCMDYDTTPNGLVAKRTEYDETGRQVRMVIYKYDLQDHLVKQEDHRYYDGREMIYRYDYWYDSTGNMREEHSYSAGKLDRVTLYSYNPKKKVALAKSFDGTGKQTFLTDYFYRDDEWTICQKQAGDASSHIFRTLDSAGLVIEKTTYNADYSKKTVETNLSFDKTGNWLTQSVTGTMTEHFFIARKIDYYE